MSLTSSRTMAGLDVSRPLATRIKPKQEEELAKISKEIERALD